MDRQLANQLAAEVREAIGQAQQALNLLEAEERWQQLEHSPRDAWLAWHKCQEAETNLHNVAVSLEKGAGKQ